MRQHEGLYDYLVHFLSLEGGHLSLLSQLRLLKGSGGRGILHRNIERVGLPLYNKATVLKKYLSVVTLLTLLPLSYVSAKPDKHSDLSEKIKVAIYLGLGIPGGIDNTYKYYDSETMQPKAKVKMAPNAGIGLVLGYSFILNQSYAIGPEVGFVWGTKRRMDIPPSPAYVCARHPRGYTIEERYLEIPIALRCEWVSCKNRSYLSVGYSLGYQLDVLLSSHYISSFGDKRDLQQDMPGLARLCSNLWVGGHLSFSVYSVELKLKFPADASRKPRRQYLELMNKSRGANATAVEIGLGIDITGWFLE
ncbi:MAG: hypothetical protein MUC61_02410 [Amoebophilaceae bacterium]|jgi:hypothetical protein|nr:hypothetical protein [Amoebophilaceae bacterium]